MTRSMLKNISVVAWGSRGDIQPYIAIGVALQKAGYNVRILTNINHASFVKSFHLLHVPINKGDSEKNLKKNPQILQAMADGDTATFFRALAHLAKENAYDTSQNFIAEMRENPPDLLLVGSYGDYHGVYAEKILSIRTLDVKLQTTVYNPKHGPCGVPTLPDGKHWDIFLNMVKRSYDNRLKHSDDAMVSLGESSLLSIYSKDTFVKETLEEPPQLRLVCQSPRFKDILYPDAHPNLTLVGACVLDAKQQQEHSDKFGGDKTHDIIERFLAADTKRKPIYLGWGSMISKSSEHMVKFAVRALKLSQQRGIVLGGWAGLSMDILRNTSDDDDELIAYAEENVLFLNEASHENLFSRVACTVHHGGAGTTNAALRSGVPTIVTPVFLDQWDHAYLINELGVGVGFDKQLQQTSAEELAKAITDVISDEDIVSRAKEFGLQLQEEGNGTEHVVSQVENFWEDKQTSTAARTVPVMQ